MALKLNSTPLALAAALSVLCTVSPAEAAPRKAELLRTWVVEGSDDLGDYGGFLKLTNATGSKVELDAELIYTDGSVRTWKSTGYYVFGKVYARYRASASGAANHLSGLPGGTEVRCTLLPNADGSELSGRYRTNDGFSGSDMLYRIGHGYRWSANVLADVLADSGLERDGLLLEAMGHDNGNGYLTRTELEDAADALGDNDNDNDPPPGPGPVATGELRILSDIDKTILPPGEPMKPPYPGIVSLYAELGGKASYVTARLPARVVHVPAWLATHGLPAGPIETGVSTLPWITEPEKVKDVKAVLAAHPDARFVLLGDSSHKDPEAYKKIMAEHADQVAAVIIHKVNPSVDPGRVAGMHLVENYAQAAAALLGEGLLDEPAARRVMEAAQADGLPLTDAEIDALLN